MIVFGGWDTKIYFDDVHVRAVRVNAGVHMRRFSW